MALVGMTTWADAPIDDTVPCPDIGGLFKDSEGQITVWVGYNPDKPILCYLYAKIKFPGPNAGNPTMTTESWVVDSGKYAKHILWVNHKSPFHPGQF